MAQNDEIILININGADRPGVTAALTEILAKNNAVKNHNAPSYGKS